MHYALFVTAGVCLYLLSPNSSQIPAKAQRSGPPLDQTQTKAHIQNETLQWSIGNIDVGRFQSSSVQIKTGNKKYRGGDSMLKKSLCHLPESEIVPAFFFVCSPSKAESQSCRKPAMKRQTRCQGIHGFRSQGKRKKKKKHRKSWYCGDLTTHLRTQNTQTSRFMQKPEGTIMWLIAMRRSESLYDFDRSIKKEHIQTPDFT